VYHDPCYLGPLSRYLRRAPAKSSRHQIGTSVIEPEADTRNAASAAEPVVDSLSSAKSTGERRQPQSRRANLRETGATVVGAACPFCNTMFSDALDKVSTNPPRLLDIAQITAAALPETAPRQ